MTAHTPSSSAIESVRNLWLELCSAKASPLTAPAELLEACSTQEKLAKYGCSDKAIRPLALNTFKDAANIAVEKGGWTILDETRRQISRLARFNSANAGTKRPGVARRLAIEKQENAALRHKNQQLLRGRALLLNAYSNALQLLRDNRTLSPRLAERLREHEVMFDIRQFSEVGAHDA